jgi:hypothetical protein
MVTILNRKKGPIEINVQMSKTKSSDDHMEIGRNICRVMLMPGSNIIDNDKYEIIKKCEYLDAHIAAGTIEVVGKEMPATKQKALEDKIKIEEAKNEQLKKEIAEMKENAPKSGTKPNIKAKDEPAIEG